MRELPVLGSFDLVCCLDDAINYLHSAEELERRCAAMRRQPGPDGLLIFDSNTLATYRGFFAEHVEMETNGRRMIWDGRGDGDSRPGTIAEASFAFEPVCRERDVDAAGLHRQRHHPEAEVRAAIAGAGLELCGLYGHGHDGIPHQPMSEEDHTKAIYVARHQRRCRAT